MASEIQFRLLGEFRRLFEGRAYLHRASTHGDFVAMHLYEDLLKIDRSTSYAEAVRERKSVLNVQNRRRGVEARRGDGTFGQLIPGTQAIADTGYAVARGPVATVEIGVEVKILAKAMIKQIERVTGDLRRQAEEFRRGGGAPICVAIVGVNSADHYISFEGSRTFPTTGRGGFLHPSQEAHEAERRLMTHAKSAYDEFLIFRFRATNDKPYPFEWVDEKDTALDYAASLVRIGGLYQRRF